MMKVVVALSALLFVAVSATPFRDCGNDFSCHFVGQFCRFTLSMVELHCF